jgi:uncharacterized membrane protein YoaK (UPF0700 family)
VTSEMRSPDAWLSFGFAFVGGYGDAAGFLLAKTFTGHITGSLVLGAIPVAAHDWRGALAHFSATACFLIGIPLSVLITRLLAARQGWPLLTITMGIEVMLIVVAYSALASHAAQSVEMLVICLSFALGLQNGAFRRTGGISVHTTYLTGLITSMVATEAEKYGSAATPRVTDALEPKSRVIRGIWAAFFAGATMGAVAVFQLRELGILGAAFILLAMMVWNSLAASREQQAAAA